METSGGKSGPVGSDSLPMREPNRLVGSEPLRKEEPDHTTGSADYSSLPLEIKRMIIREAIPDQIITVWKNHVLASGISALPLLLVDKETRDIVTERRRGYPERRSRRQPDILHFYASYRDQIISLDFASATLKVFEMQLPSADMFLGERRDLPLPFRKVLSVWKKPWGFPSRHPIEERHYTLTELDQFKDQSMRPWPTNDKLPLIEEMTFIFRFGKPFFFSINGFQPDGMSKDKLAAYSLGSDHQKGILLGFRYFKETGLIQFTPLIAAEAEFAVSEAKKIYRNRLPHYDIDCPLVVRISLIERGERPRDEPYHTWTDLRQPNDDDPNWFHRACNAWKLACETWACPLYAKTKIYYAGEEDIPKTVDDQDEEDTADGGVA
ncbi:hypothetical protein G7Z17_g2080 [Cylindrodendrum hubeiense]|uniref:Uncharacterized protein n=1 Tax=Cylindrodendrum hubeiense TaxID=595255 RepID=A0A9P5HEU3_9HYPO|nr:hypothetical protein G7Z17_g2080 [Cylindrodendrum hubeiense]